MQRSTQLSKWLRRSGERANYGMEHYLTQLRKEIDRKYEYKYSTLVLLFADLIREGKLNAEELRGLGEDKLHYIR